MLHLLDDPGGAINDAATLLRPGGRLLVADFAPHELERLRLHHGHRPLGISEEDMRDWALARASSWSANGRCRRPTASRV